MRVEVTTWTLEQRSRDEVRPAAQPDLPLLLMRAERPSPELGRFLYTAVGGNWYWVDRLSWTYERWLEWQSKGGVETWVAYLRGTPAGYFELDASEAGEVELAYFGLLPSCVGRGMGGWLLTRALERAWELRRRRVWVHTCTLDGPGALANYQARGMRVCRVETHQQELDDEPPGPWPGAGVHGLSPQLDAGVR
jgi:GNAT superfamily N-acetyltransferase